MGGLQLTAVGRDVAPKSHERVHLYGGIHLRGQVGVRISQIQARYERWAFEEPRWHSWHLEARYISMRYGHNDYYAKYVCRRPVGLRIPRLRTQSTEAPNATVKTNACSAVGF